MGGEKNNKKIDEDSFVTWKKNAIWDAEEPGFPSVPYPETPKEPLEFLSRSWSVSASEISKKLNANYATPEKVTPYQSAAKAVSPTSLCLRRSGPIGRWFNNKDYNSCTVKKKDKARIDNAHIHSALCVAGLAAALHAVAAEENKKGTPSKMSQAMASATELLAHHCLELAEASGADHERVKSTFRSAKDIRSAGDLVTLTAAAATALRGEAALKARTTKDSRRNASVLPCDKSTVESQDFPNCHYEGADVPCVGDLLQHTKKGPLEWKHVTAYVNQKSQVKIKLRSKNVVASGAFCKKKKCVVCEVCDDVSLWPARKARDNVEVYFGAKTSHGFLEFKCKNKIHREKWVRGIKDQFGMSGFKQEVENSKRMLNLNINSCF